MLSVLHVCAAVRINGVEIIIIIIPSLGHGGTVTGGGPRLQVLLSGFLQVFRTSRHPGLILLQMVPLNLTVPTDTGLFTVTNEHHG